jgi:hypothetical protein
MIDPTEIIIGNSGSGSAGSGTVNSGDGSGTLNLSVYSAFSGFSQITLQATRDITLAVGATWNLAQSTGQELPDCHLTLQAGRNIIFGNNAALVATADWAVDLVAGATFTTPTSVSPGAGSIYLGGGPTTKQNGSLQSERGDLRLFAGGDVLVGSGFIRTSAGGNIQITTASGDVNAGTKTQTYDYSRNGYQVSSLGSGGIATTAGGDVTITAGRDVLSSLATVGALGSQPGNVSIEAGQRIMGNYLVRNGEGHLVADNGSVGSASEPMNLSLVSGGWTVESLKADIFLNEIRNPNGIFNNNTIRGLFNGQSIDASRQIAHLFDYAPDASLTLRAANSVQLTGANLPRPNDGLPPIYPPQLDIRAGAGGIVLGNEIQMYPSALGSLKLTTTGGGSLQSLGNSFYQLVMSDSSDPRYTTFASGHATSPLHLNDPLPVQVDISGEVRNLFLRVPKRANINIGGNAYNFAFEGQNLHPDDQTAIAIGGELGNRTRLTSVPLSEAPDFTIFDPLYTMNQSLGARLSYDPATGLITAQNKLTVADRDFLLNPTIRQYDIFNNLIVDDLGQPVTVPAVFTKNSAPIQALYNNSQDIPTSALAYQGFQLGGQGTFKFSAHDMDLGISQGIRAVADKLNPNLAAIADPAAPAGAHIDMTLEGDLNMTSSQIGSFGGGGISIKAGGNLNIGSQTQFSSDDVPKGIYTTSGGDIAVDAQGDINVNGSRIATFDGGNLTIRSTGGDVNAGAGGLGVIVFSRTLTDPVSGERSSVLYHIGISGIAATSFPDSGRVCGDILIEAARDILANFGGIRQAAFLGGLSAGAKIVLTAGRNIQAGLSGVVGENIKLDAQGDIEGLVVARENLSITSVQNVNVLAVAGAGASVSAGGDVGGRIASSGASSVDSKTVSADVITHSANVSGDSSKASVGVQATAPARVEKVADASESIAKATSVGTKNEEEDLNKKNTRPAPKLIRTIGRVTVILPTT